MLAEKTGKFSLENGEAVNSFSEFLHEFKIFRGIQAGNTDEATDEEIFCIMINIVCVNGSTMKHAVSYVHADMFKFNRISTMEHKISKIGKHGIINYLSTIKILSVLSI